MNLVLSTDARHQILAHVQAMGFREAVGLLGGTAAGEVTAVLPLRNIATDERAFLADPFAQFCALKKLQTEGRKLLAIYHSHPNGGLDPSETDIAHARRWACAHLVVAVDTQGLTETMFRAFRVDARGGVEDVEIRAEGTVTKAT